MARNDWQRDTIRLVMGAPRRTAAGAQRPPRRRGRVLLVVAGVVLVLAGVALLLMPVLGVWQRGRTDDSALSTWRNGGSSALVGIGHDSKDVPTAAPAAAACGAAGAPADQYALVTFPSLAQYGYAGVAGDGTWDMLTQRSMVHYRTTPAPGAQGNVIIAFHREPHYEHIDQLGVGGTVDVQDRSCVVWHYRVTQRWTLTPDRVTQLVPTSGHDLTLITCTPWWVDSQRLVWRLTLVGSDRAAA